MPNGSGEVLSSANARGPSGEHRPSAIRHSLAPYSAQGRRAGGRLAGSGFVCYAGTAELCLGGFLEREMGMHVGLRRFDRLMTEPQRDHRTIDASL